MGNIVVCLSLRLSVCCSVSSISHERVNGRRPNIGRWIFYTIYVHSPGGDTAGALAEFALSGCSCCFVTGAWRGTVFGRQCF